ncbi:DUF6457 domain-containing protein [Aeromicrobium sp. CTD01-1L150]|uniref:DUF6457 domain-containing protein n=1 Tax=Aeromicrobium sp. CTD01-1L150 TaxID=3341830 RepID=UPI0035BF4FCD
MAAERDEPQIEDWWKQLCAELGVAAPADPAAILDLAATAAHQVVRPAAPLTTFLVGYAAGLAGGGEQAVQRAHSTAQALAERDS